MAIAIAIAPETAGEAAEQEYDQDNDEYRSKRHGALPEGPRASPKTLAQPGSKHIPGRESLVDPPETSAPSFRDDAKHRTLVHNCAPENLEIPRCAIAHLGSGANAPSGDDDYVVTSSSRRSAAPSAASHRARREGSPWRSGRSCAAAPARDRRRRICAPRIATRSSSPWRPASWRRRRRSGLPSGQDRPR